MRRLTSPRCSPHEKYAPWFRQVLRCAQLAVHIATMLEGESRASKLSFNDVVKRLAEQAEDAPTFISKRVRPWRPGVGGGTWQAT